MPVRQRGPPQVTPKVTAGLWGKAHQQVPGDRTSNMVVMSEYLDFISSPQEVRLQ
jgi:hypothetical protein